MEQLWAGDPAELWSTAKRMLDVGLSREAVLDRPAGPPRAMSSASRSS
ncbi:MAG: hypothetical protein JO345_24730 [Streptosporangiaceae bacterium]|nr:hypothetical protein [Streptosporangiaceae bacterium]